MNNKQSGGGSGEAEGDGGEIKMALVGRAHPHGSKAGYSFGSAPEFDIAIYPMKINKTEIDFKPPWCAFVFVSGASGRKNCKCAAYPFQTPFKFDLRVKAEGGFKEYQLN